jgi:hypothetical protein
METTTDKIDAVSIEIPLLLRLFEYAREDATTDEDLHIMAENLLEVSAEKEGAPLDMKCYQKIIPSKEESTTASAVGSKDVSLFTKKDKPEVSKINSIAESVRRVLSGSK